MDPDVSIQCITEWRLFTMRKFIVLLFVAISMFCLSSCETDKDAEFQIGTAAVEYDGIIYLADEHTGTIRCYDLTAGTQEILLEDVSVDSIVLDWPELWMIEGSSRLLKLNVSSGRLETVYTSDTVLNGLFFLYEDSIYFEESVDYLNVNCKRLNPETGKCTIFLENSNINLSFHISFYKNQLFYTSTGGSVFCVAMDDSSEPQLVDADSWFTIIGTDSALYYSKYVNGIMQTMQYEAETDLPGNNNYSFFRASGSVGDTLFASVCQDGNNLLLQINSQGTSIVFENCDQFIYSDTPSMFYFLDSGIVFWNNKNLLDFGDVSDAEYYIFLYDYDTESYQILDEICQENTE